MKTLRLNLATLLPVLLFCTINPISDNGGTTEIPNAKIVGYIYTSSPAAFLPADTAPLGGASVTLHSLIFPKRTVSTDAAGFFMFDSVDTGRYWIEGTAYDTIGRVVVCDVGSKDTAAPQHIVLRRMGRIRGKINIDTTGINPDTIFKTTRITIQEIGIQLNVTGNGFFETRPIPPFNSYTIVVSNLTFPWVSRMFKAGVKENETTILDNTNTPPRFIHDGTAMCDTATLYQEYRDTVHAYDPDGDALTFIVERGPKDMSITDSVISWTPRMPCPHMGRVNVSIQVQDNRGGYDTLSWMVTVRNRWDNPGSEDR